MNSVFIEVKDNIGDKVYINMDKIVFIHRPSRTVCLDMIDGAGNGVISLSDEALEKIVNNITVKYDRSV